MFNLIPWLGGAAAIAVVLSGIYGFSKGKEFERARCEAAAQRAKERVEIIDRQVRNMIEQAGADVEKELSDDLQRTEAENEKLRQQLKADTCIIVPDDLNRL